MTTILAPYHQGERLADAEIPVHADVTVTAEFPAGADLWQQAAVTCAAIAEPVAAAVRGGRVPVVFSGDCLLAGGTVAGAQRAGRDPGVVWFDAHGDVHTLETSTSGYLGGMSLRVLTGAHPERYADAFGLRPVAPERAVLADARDLDPAEAEYLAGSATRRIPVAEVDTDTVPAGDLVIHVDADVIDAGELPGLRYPVPGGPSTEAVLDACARLVATGRVVAIHVACPWLPTGDRAEREIRDRLVSRFAAGL
ncbi:arginase [Actinoplanes octamycinicus]|uniref:Arginase n=1 Tax=Actinoplanes octamycinicus TaxID=135948 RepID=A0A7W7H479_9ACTN|nr:arginase family protein [Actinoplanes octamycinicus]MBB4743618.1 arginase [Actinoplanes octamycinicus]GIE61043.1 arginase [Actinoplanes octamycinicus]